MHHYVKFPARAIKLVGCQRSGKTLLAHAYAASVSKLASECNHMGDVLFITDRRMIPEVSAVILELGGVASKLKFVGFTETMKEVFPFLSGVGTVIFDVDAVIREDGIFCYEAPSDQMRQYIERLSEPTAFIPYVVITAHNENEMNHPALG